jgi:hypothetical protein
MRRMVAEVWATWQALNHLVVDLLDPSRFGNVAR